MWLMVVVATAGTRSALLFPPPGSRAHLRVSRFGFALVFDAHPCVLSSHSHPSRQALAVSGVGMHKTSIVSPD